MGQYVLLDVSDVPNVVLGLIEAEPDYTPEAGFRVVPLGPGAAPGGTWADGVFTPPAAPPSNVSGDAIIGAISRADRAKCDPLDLTRIAWRDDVPVTNAKLARIAKAIDTSPDALRQAAAATS